MKAEDKAFQLFDKMWSARNPSGESSMSRWQAKQCALIAVDEILEEIAQLNKPEYTIFITCLDPIATKNGYEKEDFWQDVKTEIEKL